VVWIYTSRKELTIVSQFAGNINIYSVITRSNLDIEVLRIDDESIEQYFVIFIRVINTNYHQMFGIPIFVPRLLVWTSVAQAKHSRDTRIMKTWIRIPFGISWFIDCMWLNERLCTHHNELNVKLLANKTYFSCTWCVCNGWQQLVYKRGLNMNLG
jgi:hypothetical protein